jgi:replication-associated recombination protein RarA
VSLFDNLPQGGSHPVNEQAGFAFPASLTEKYRPHTFAEFVGIEKPRRIMANFAANPKPDAFLFVGPSGIGKTSLALAFFDAIAAELHHVPSQQCNVASLETVIANCHRAPWNLFGPNAGKASRFHGVLVDEAHKMGKAAQLHLLSKLDATAFPPSTVFIFTANSTDGLEDTFISRCKLIQFSSHGVAEETAQLLERIWEREAGQAEKPNFLRIVRDSGNNVRNALNMLETEILAA